MRGNASAGDRPKPGFDVRNWTAHLDLKASVEGDEFVLAAIYRALFTGGAKALTRSLYAEAKRCQNDHRNGTHG